MRNSALMDVLIREYESQLSIGMKPRRVILLVTVIALTIGIVASTSFSPGSDASQSFLLSQDETRPTIWAWGIEGSPELLEPFSVWANVTDDELGSGIRNVTLIVNGPNATIRDTMVYNASSELYEKDVAALPNDGIFSMTLFAFDMENNSRSTYDVFVTVSVSEEPPPNPLVTLPVVVGGSLAAALVVCVVAYQYDKRRPVETAS